MGGFEAVGYADVLLWTFIVAGTELGLSIPYCVRWQHGSMAMEMECPFLPPCTRHNSQKTPRFTDVNLWPVCFELCAVN